MNDSYLLAPGNILINSEIESRIKEYKKNHQKQTLKFIEIGAGNGHVSEIFLKNGFEGIGIDMNSNSNEVNKSLNLKYVSQSKYEISNQNFFEIDFGSNKYNVIISSMVIEHMNPDEVGQYMEKVKSLLSDDGIIITVVPANQKYWGIEDEIAGHYKRYSRKCFEHIAQEHSFDISYYAFLTYPLSNILYNLSNFLIKRYESHKLGRSQMQNTIDSSSREVKFKTVYPGYFRYLVNKFTMLPFIILQKIFSKNPEGLVLYCELLPKGRVL